MNQFILLLLHPGIVAIILTCILVFIFSLYKFATDQQVKRRWEIVAENSEYYQQLLMLNAQSGLDMSIYDEQKHTYRSRSQTTFDYEKMDRTATLAHLLQGKTRYEILDMLEIAEQNRKKYQAYELSFQQMASTITQEQCKKLRIQYDDFRAMEATLVLRNKIYIYEQFAIVCLIECDKFDGYVARKPYRFSEKEIRRSLGMDTNDQPKVDEEVLRRKQERNRITPSVRYQVITRDGGRCCVCGRSVKDGITLEVDHIIPISRGGNSDADNLQTLCRDCNRGKGASI